jgi:hypothetical protein
VEAPQAAAGPDHAASSALPVFVPLGKPFQVLFGICRSTQAELIRKGELRSVLVGEIRGRRVIETGSWFEYVERQRQRERAGEIGMASPNPRARQRQSVSASARETERTQSARHHRTISSNPGQRKTHPTMKRTR